jgi:hypothetical protein
MNRTLIEAFDECFKHVKFDKNLAKRIYQFQSGYVSKNHEHLEFFGGNLLGVHVIRFKDSDVNQFYDQILDVDYQDLSISVRKVDTISHDFKVNSDILNLTLMYVLHRWYTAEGMDDKQRMRAAYDTAMVFFYRCIAALMSYYFKYPTDPKLAQMAYANLSNKYLIKKLGSWHKVMDYRANDLISKEGLHYNNLKLFKDDASVVYAISDSQGRIGDLMKNYTKEFYKVHEEGTGVASTSGSYLDADGEMSVKEKTKSVESYISYIQSCASDPASFIKDPMISVIVKINVNTSFRMVKSVLAWLVENYNQGKDHKDIDEFLRLCVVQSMYFIENNMELKNRRDYPYMLHQLKNLYLSTRTTDPEVEKIRDLGQKLIKKSTKNISDSLVLATRTSIILYISLRAIVGQQA